MLHGYLFEFLKVLQLDADGIFAKKISALAIALGAVQVSLGVHDFGLSLDLGESNLGHDSFDFLRQV